MPIDLSSLPVKQGFRLRGEAISRLETLVDAAFAFALSMLVVSVGAVPKSVPELFDALLRAPTFAASFTIMALFWSAHNRWSRRYGLDDAGSTVLSLVFMCVMLIWVYPQRMILSSAAWFMSNHALPLEFEIQTARELEHCFAVYSAGFGVLSFLILLLHRHALRSADALQLDAIERLRTREELAGSLVAVVVACISFVLALVIAPRADEVRSGWVIGAPGFCYALLGLGYRFVGRRLGREERELLASGAVVRDGRVLTAADVK